MLAERMPILGAIMFNGRCRHRDDDDLWGLGKNPIREQVERLHTIPLLLL